MHLNYLADERTAWEIRLPSFYLPPGSTDTLASTPCFPFPADARPVELLVAQEPIPLCDFKMDGTWLEVSSALPLWSELLMRMYAWEDARPAWKLYEAVPLEAAGAD